MVQDALRQDEIDNCYVLETLDQTPHSVILYDQTGKRAIHADLKDIQQQSYPVQSFEQVLNRF